MSTFTIGGYGPGHPWFYVLGRAPLTTKQIIACVQARDTEGIWRARSPVQPTAANLVDRPIFGRSGQTS